MTNTPCTVDSAVRAMNIDSFNDFLSIARREPEPQRLLFVFAGAELPEAATSAQLVAFERNEGGELTPLMCVDKAVGELRDFDALASEAERAGPRWSIVFAAALSGGAGTAPSASEIERSLQRMVDSIMTGQLQSTLPFDREGYPVQFV
jgi:hypothetical protein